MIFSTLTKCINIFMQPQTQVLKIRHLLNHDRCQEENHDNHVGPIRLLESNNNNNRGEHHLYWCEFNFQKLKFVMYPDCVSRKHVSLEIELKDLLDEEKEQEIDDDDDDTYTTLRIKDDKNEIFHFLFRDRDERETWKSAIRFAIRIRRRRERRKSSGRNTLRDALGISSSPTKSFSSSPSISSSFSSSASSSSSSSSSWLNKTYECAERYLKSLRYEHDAVVKILEDHHDTPILLPETPSLIPHPAKRLARTIQKENLVSGRTLH